jgi:hypothetical protein
MNFYTSHGIQIEWMLLERYEICVGFSVLTAMVMKNSIFCCLRYASFYPEDGGEILPRNVGWISLDYTALNPPKQNFSVRNLSTSFFFFFFFFYIKH